MLSTAFILFFIGSQSCERSLHFRIASDPQLCCSDSSSSLYLVHSLGFMRPLCYDQAETLTQGCCTTPALIPWHYQRGTTSQRVVGPVKQGHYSVFEHPRHDVPYLITQTTPTPCSLDVSSGGGVVGEQQSGTRDQSASAAGWDGAPRRTQGSAPRPQSAPAVSAGGDRRGWTRRPPQEERRRTSRGSATVGRDCRAEAAARQIPHRGVVDGRHRRGEAGRAGGGRQGTRGSGGGQPGSSRRFGGTVSHARPATAIEIQLRAAVHSNCRRKREGLVLTADYYEQLQHGVINVSKQKSAHRAPRFPIVSLLNTVSSFPNTGPINGRRFSPLPSLFTSPLAYIWK